MRWREEEARRREEEANRAAEQMRKVLEETRRREEESRRREEEARQLAEDNKRVEQEARQREAEAQAREAESKRQEEEARKAAIKAQEEEERAKKNLEQTNVLLSIGVWPSEEEFNLAQARIEYNSQKVHLAICGSSGAGKSSLINAFRGSANRDPGAAPAGVVETTVAIDRYPDARAEFPYSHFVWFLACSYVFGNMIRNWVLRSKSEFIDPIN
jgi:ATPase subunit of ABC transporter with duplicated ATPase domains